MGEPEDDFPESPLSEAAIGWVHLNVMFRDCVAAGFTERQACWIIAGIVSHVSDGGNE